MNKERAAVIGMACRFPAANNLDEFWRNLQQGRDCISEIPTSRWDMQAFYDENIPAPNKNTSYAKWAGIIDEFDQFDAGFFNISAREACTMDPQQRLLLQETWHCIEHSGIALQELQQSNTSVFVGAMAVDYQHHLTDLSQPVASHSTLGGYSGLLSNRISWCFDLKGESLTIDTACSGSLVALHKASQSLIAGECDYAIVAGVNILCHPWKHLSFSKLRMFSPEGRCNTFDISANGYVPGEGIGVILLTSEQKLKEHRATCYGYIDGSAVNHNGKNRSITVPDVAAQTRLITQALTNANRCIDDISYIEAHGTGTSLGDPIEMEALNHVFSDKQEPCFVGALKTHIGHLEAASGLAGVIHVLLMMSHQTLIGIRNFTQENPLIAFKKTPLTPVLNNQPWTGNKIAAINSFGFGGTNAHIIVSQPIASKRLSKQTTETHLPLLISAQNTTSLKRCVQQWLELLNHSTLPDSHLYGASLENHTAPWRIHVLANNRQEMLQKLRALHEETLSSDSAMADALHIRLLTDAQFETYRKQLPGIEALYQQWSTQWPESRMRPILQTIAFYQTLLRAGITVQTLCCDKKSVAATCVISGLISIDTLPALMNQEPVMLNVSSYTIVNEHQVLLPLLPESIKQALAVFSVRSETFLSIITESQQLLIHQSIFRQALFSWAPLFKEQGISVDAVFENQATYSTVQRSVVLLAILVARAELNRKWQLKEKHTQLPPVLRLIAGLVSQKQLSPHQAVALFSEEITDNFIQEIAYRAALTTHCMTLKAIIAQMSAALPSANLNYMPLHAEYTHNMNEADVTHGALMEQLCNLWQNGANIHWRTLLPDYCFTAKARPLYPFNTQKYWINDKTTMHDEKETSMEKTPIAIIGFSGRFPGADNPQQLWENLINNVCSVTEIPASRWDTEQYWDPDPRAQNKSYSKWGGVLDGVDQFDASFFNILPSDAMQMDPQHRLVLEEGWKTLEMAGYTGERLKNDVCGLYVGCMGNDYYEKHLTDLERDITAAEYIGNSNSILSARLAYHLDLKGPALTIDTACSSSLVCTHLACEALRSGDADIMLAGGVTLWLTETPYISMSKASMLSPEGLCKTFDNSADGFVPGEGVCFVLLKRLPEAIEDGDQIYGVIKGSGINQDGKSNGISAPNLDAQAKLIEHIYQRNHIDPTSIQYIETHGTGTKLGDPVEVSALARAFSRSKKSSHTCALGALKSNIGHTSAAAGVSGLIKILLSLKEKTLAPNANFNTPNTLIDFENSPFYVLTQQQHWVAQQGPRRAALSSFGFSGTNAHMVIEEAPESVLRSTNVLQKLPFPITARNPELLRQNLHQLARWIEQHPDAYAQDVSFTLCFGRAVFAERTLFWADSLAHLHQQLQNVADPEAPPMEFSSLHEQFLKRKSIQWQTCFATTKGRIVALPGQPFHKSSYWLPHRATSERSTPEPTVPNTLNSGHQSAVYSLELSASHPLFLEHRVNGTPVLPGAATLSFIGWHQPEFPFNIRSARWLRPLTAHDQQLEFEEKPDGRITVKTDGSTLYMTALKHQQGTSEAPSIIPVPPEPLWQKVDQSQLYRRFRERGGLHYTGGFERIEKRCYYDNALYTSVCRPKSYLDKLHREASFLDGILQIVLLFNEGNKAETQVPYMVDSWTCYASLPDHVIVRAQQRQNVADVTIADTSGQVLQTFWGLRLEKIASIGDTREQSAIGVLLPQECTVPLPAFVDETKTLYLDNLASSLSLSELHGVDRVVVTFADHQIRPFQDKLYEYVLGTFALLNTLQSIPRQTPFSLEYRLLSQSPMDEVLIEPLSAILNIVSMESSTIRAKLISSQQIRYHEQRSEQKGPHVTIQKGSTWLITGGAGGLGFTLARELAKNYQANVLLCGRSKPSAKHQKKIELLEALGGQASYHCVDCTDYETLSAFINNITTPLNGVIHCAGILNSDLVKHKTPQGVNQVIAAKVAGTLNLDVLTQHLPLDFFVLTSSISSLFPVAGLSDYGYGNAFLNHFSRYRTGLTHSGKRRGKSLSICWPHWDTDGMPLVQEEIEWCWLRYGFKSLSEEGAAAFIHALQTVESPHCVIAKGDIHKITTSLNKIKE